MDSKVGVHSVEQGGSITPSSKSNLKSATHSDDPPLETPTKISQSSSIHSNTSNKSITAQNAFWECSLCTFKNSADTFKCDVCEAARRGSSTRKPRTTSDIVVAQVLRQQEQIRQQAIKVTKPRTSSTFPSSSSRTSNGRSKTSLVENIDSGERDSDSSDTSLTSIDSQYAPTTTLKKEEVTQPEIQKPTNSKTEINTGPPKIDHRVVVCPLGDGSNQFKYSPPESCGKAGLIIDKRRFTQHSITVNDVTVTFTEFATRRKKEAEPKKKKKKKKKRLVGAAAASAAAAAANAAAVATATTSDLDTHSGVATPSVSSD